MIELLECTPELRTRILRKVSFDEHLRLVWQDGESDIAELLYSFEEAVNFISMDPLRIVGRPGMPAVIDFSALKIWIEDIIGDWELARAIVEVTGNGDDLTIDRKLVMIKSVKELMESRLAQCTHIRKEATV